MAKSVLKRKMFKIVVVIVVIVTAMLFVSAYMRGNIVPTIAKNAEASVRALGVVAINNAANTVITTDIKYDDFFTIEKASNGDIVMVYANSPYINRVAREIANLTQANLAALGPQELNIPIGTFTGFSFMVGFGPDVSVRFTPIGTANCSFFSEFLAAGINQTLHKIYMTVTANIIVSTAVYDLEVAVEVEILVAENMLVGKIPDTYLSIGSLDLIP